MHPCEQPMENGKPSHHRNNVLIRGTDSPTMIFAHGFGCDQSMWRFVAPAFQSSHRVVTFDYVGSGNSDLSQYDSRRYATLEGYALDVIEIVRELDVGPVVFVGHSVSSMIGMIASIRYPELFSRLVLSQPECPRRDYCGNSRVPFSSG
jgi:sigma-B regulation protein RsbQ